MAINPTCLRKLIGLGLPMKVTGTDKHGKPFTADIDTLGTVMCNKAPYSSPSALRDALVGSHKSTYDRLFYRGLSLRDHGVRR
jgi:hypothetical protein